MKPFAQFCTRSLFVATTLMLAACNTQSHAPTAESQAAPDANFAGYKTFSWMDRPSDAPPLTLYEQRIRTAIAGEMTKRGYQETSQKPDLRIAYETLAQDKVKSNPFTFGIGMGSFGGNTGGGVGVNTSGVDTYTEGRLNVRAVDAETNKEVWIGTVVGRMKESDRATDKEIQPFVAMAMEQFPTRPHE
jgi:uncharacterized protein DUF4136